MKKNTITQFAVVNNVKKLFSYVILMEIIKFNEGLLKI